MINTDKFLLYVVTTSLNDDINFHYSMAKICLEGGAKIIQFRDKDIDNTLFIKLAIKIGALSLKKNAYFIINDRVTLFQNIVHGIKEKTTNFQYSKVGLHIGQHDISFLKTREIIGKESILGISAANIQEALKAQADGADYIGVGPVFKTISKNNAGESLGLDKLNKIVNAVTIPVVAIGGINESNFEDVIKTGVSGAAMISAFYQAQNMRELTKKLINVGINCKKNQDAN